MWEFQLPSSGPRKWVCQNQGIVGWRGKLGF
ncbi:rCG53887 [Rattus norvegicus]|uniref:RCG53887 n=1 Tax=Rattus norvegicus TaxID=10116 RepID=A6J8C7_RAT|nr:rCG53887 [Rattus norvegicus]